MCPFFCSPGNRLIGQIQDLPDWENIVILPDREYPNSSVPLFIPGPKLAPAARPLPLSSAGTYCTVSYTTFSLEAFSFLIFPIGKLSSHVTICGGARLFPIGTVPDRAIHPTDKQHEVKKV